MKTIDKARNQSLSNVYVKQDGYEEVERFTGKVLSI
jgi:hypothetical protein